MPTINIGSVLGASDAITTKMFGGNALIHRNLLGEDGINESFFNLGMTAVRYPGGTITEQTFDVTDPDNVTLRFGSVDYTLTGGEHLKFSDFMDWAEQSNLHVNFVLPTYDLIDRDTGNIRADKVDEVLDFARTLLDPNGPYAGVSIETLEIGNEYWGIDLTAEQYGKIANAVLPGLHDIVNEFGSDTSLLIQIGDPWGPDAQGKLSGMTWNQKLLTANTDIVSQLGQDARDAIDGIVSHVYMKEGRHLKEGDNLNIMNAQVSDWNVSLGPWKAAGIDVPLAVTEWNINSDQNQQGLMGAGTYLEMFSLFTLNNVDWADTWPVQLNSRYKLDGEPDNPSLSFTGAAFKMISLLDGYQALNTGQNGGDIEINVYGKNVDQAGQGSDDYVIHMISRSDQNQWIDSFDMSRYVGDDMPARIRVLTYDPSTADGRDWRLGGTTNVALWNDGGAKPIFYELAPSDVENGFNLPPFAVIEIVYGDIPLNKTTDQEGQAGDGDDDPIIVPPVDGGDDDEEPPVTPPGGGDDDEDPPVMPPDGGDDEEPPVNPPDEGDDDEEEPPTGPPPGPGPGDDQDPPDNGGNPVDPPDDGGLPPVDPPDDGNDDEEPPVTPPDDGGDDEDPPSGGEPPEDGGGTPPKEDPDDRDDEEKDEKAASCFIASAAYGGSSHPDVARMREIRDKTLVHSAIGRALVRLYWRVGPHVAARVTPDHPMARLVRWLVGRIT